MYQHHAAHDELATHSAQQALKLAVCRWSGFHPPGVTSPPEMPVCSRTSSQVPGGGGGGAGPAHSIAPLFAFVSNVTLVPLAKLRVHTPLLLVALARGGPSGRSKRSAHL